MAATNLAAEYRILGHPRLAFRWWSIAAGIEGGGDHLLEIAYCLQHGVGVRRDREAALHTYERALRAHNTTAHGHEEARYHLATMLLETRPRPRGRAARLLRDANRDDDYPQARELLEQLSSKRDLSICHCRRGLARSLGRSARCDLHRQS